MFTLVILEILILQHIWRTGIHTDKMPNKPISSFPIVLEVFLYHPKYNKPEYSDHCHFITMKNKYNPEYNFERLRMLLSTLNNVTIK